MGLIRQPLGAPPLPLSKIDGDGETSGSRGDVHGRASGEIEATGDEDPAVRVPCPAGDGVVDECGPDEYEDEEGPEARAFCYGADGEDRAVSSDFGPGKEIFVRDISCESWNEETYVMAANMSW